MACGGCAGKKKKVNSRKMPSDFVAQSEYRNSVMNVFMASRDKLTKNKK